MSRALDHLYKRVVPADYRLLMQIHDAVLLECRPDQLDLVYDKVLPTCMTDLVEIWPCYVNGVRKPEITQPYKLGIGRDVYEYWGQDLTTEDCKRLGISERYSH